MDADVVSTIISRVVSILTAGALIYIYFWWRGRKKKKQ